MFSFFFNLKNFFFSQKWWEIRFLMFQIRFKQKTIFFIKIPPYTFLHFFFEIFFDLNNSHNIFFFENTLSKIRQSKFFRPFGGKKNFFVPGGKKNFFVLGGKKLKIPNLKKGQRRIVARRKTNRMISLSLPNSSWFSTYI